MVNADGTPVSSTPPSGDVAELMHELGAWLGQDAQRHHAVVAAVLAHPQLVAIHPFNDGSGPTARALSRMILARHGYTLDGLVSLDAQLDLDRPHYFTAIRAAIGPAYAPGYDATPFVSYFLRALVASADSVLARIRGLGEVMVRIRRAIADGLLPPTLVDGLAFAWVNRHFRARHYIRLTGRSPQATTRGLAAAVAGGWLVATGEPRGRYYMLAPELLEVPAAGEVASGPA